MEDTETGDIFFKGNSRSNRDVTEAMRRNLASRNFSNGGYEEVDTATAKPRAILDILIRLSVLIRDTVLKCDTTSGRVRCLVPVPRVRISYQLDACPRE